MNIWTVIRSGEVEARSAWVSRELAWEAALVFAEKTRGELTKKSMGNIARVSEDYEDQEIIVET